MSTACMSYGQGVGYEEWKECHVFQWLRRGFGFVNRFIGSLLVVTTISSYTLKITVTIAHVTSHMKFSNSSGHTAVPLELGSSTEVNSNFRILLYPLGTDHAQETKFYCRVVHTTQKTSHVITASSVHWRAGCCSQRAINIHPIVAWPWPLPSYTRYSMDKTWVRIMESTVHSESMHRACEFVCKKQVQSFNRAKRISSADNRRRSTFTPQVSSEKYRSRLQVRAFN
jgi:hypothetical protein